MWKSRLAAAGLAFAINAGLYGVGKQQSPDDQCCVGMNAQMGAEE